jgi:hypothetical protein
MAVMTSILHHAFSAVGSAIEILCTTRFTADEIGLVHSSLKVSEKTTVSLATGIELQQMLPQYQMTLASLTAQTNLNDTWYVCRLTPVSSTQAQPLRSDCLILFPRGPRVLKETK